jgi:hypothetical protein
VASRDHPDAVAAVGKSSCEQAPGSRNWCFVCGCRRLAAHFLLFDTQFSPEWTFIWFFMVLVGGLAA